jgi:hypothetical protein
MTWPITAVATGDLVTSAQHNQLPIALAEATGAAASYDFTSIPQVWTHLLVVAFVLDGAGGSLDALNIRFNNDTAANYYYQRLRGEASTASASETLAATSAVIGNVPAVSTAGFSSIALWIPNYAAVQKHTYTSQSFGNYGISSGNLRLDYFGGYWNSAAAINRVTVFPGAGSFVDGSIATLYGMGAI